MVAFLLMSSSFFIAIIQRALKAYFAWKQLKVDYLKDIWKTNSQAWFSFYLGWLNISDKKLLNTNNSVSAPAHKLWKLASLWPNFDPYILDIWKLCKG